MVEIKNKNPKIKCYVDGRRETLEPLSIVFNGMMITVEEGFVCDGSSIPRFFWRVTGSPTTGPNLLAGIMHDAVYRYHILPRDLCDKMFYEILLELGKPKWIAWCMWKAVEIFGGKHYK